MQMAVNQYLTSSGRSNRSVSIWHTSKQPDKLAFAKVVELLLLLIALQYILSHIEACPAAVIIYKGYSLATSQFFFVVNILTSAEWMSPPAHLFGYGQCPLYSRCVIVNEENVSYTHFLCISACLLFNGIHITWSSIPPYICSKSLRVVKPE